MALETTIPQSRRTLLAAGVGGLLATIAATLGRPLAVRGNNGDTLTAGNTFTATATTGVTTTGGNGLQGVLNAESYSQAGSAIYGEANGSYAAYAVYGKNTQGYGSGVRGEAGDNSIGVEGYGGDLGVYGHSVKALGFGGTGVTGWAESANGTGVSARASGAGGKGLQALADDGVAIVASSGALSPPAPTSKTGVYGYAAQDASAMGVSGQSTAGTGVKGEATMGAGVYGLVDSGIGVHARSGTGYGVFAYSESGNALFAERITGSGAALRAQHDGAGPAVEGVSGPPSGAPAPQKTGVYGYAIQDATSRGVTGRSTAGRGVNGLATTGYGVYGNATSGRGVYGTATTGIAGQFASSSGTALQVSGKAKFSSAGLATILAGNSSVTVTPGLDVTSSSKILCTLHGNPGASVTIHRVARNTVADTFTIHLTGNAGANTPVAWFLIG